MGVYRVFRSMLPFALVVLFAFFFFGGPDSYSTRYFKAFWNLGHIVFFALLPYCVFTRLKRWPDSFAVQSLLTIGGCIALGVLIELVQYDFQRSPDMGDVFRDVIGGMVGMFFLLPSRRTVRRKFLRVFQAVAVCMVGLQVYPVITALSDAYLARGQFPVLSGFETPWEMERWTNSADCEIDGNVYIEGKYSMCVLLGTQLYSGVSLKYFPENWEGAQSLRFSIYNPGQESVYLTCRINDQKHNEGRYLYVDRFNRRYAFPMGWHTVEINMEDVRNAPKGRQMDLRHIKGMGIFAMQLPQPRVVYIDDVRLVYASPMTAGSNRSGKQ